MSSYEAKYGLGPQRFPLRKISGRISLTRLVMAMENLFRCFWPLFTLILFAYAFIAFKGLNILPDLAGKGLMLVAAIAAIYLFVRGAMRFRWPSRQAALFRLDADLPGHPIAALQDESALGKSDPLTREIWAAHQEMMEAKLDSARMPSPDPQLAKRDIAGLRLLAIVAGMATLVFAPGAQISNIVDQVTGSVADIGPSVAIEAWATPPRYTGKPTLYLTEIDNGETLDLPVNTVITIRTYGDGAFELGETVSGENTTLASDDPEITVRDVSFTILQSGAFGVRDGREVLGDWFVTMIPDLPPTLAVPDGVDKTVEGELEIAYEAQDDYGIETATVSIRPDLSLVDRRFGLIPDPVVPDLMTRDLPLPFTQDRTKIKETFIDDFSQQMWVGLPVVITLNVTDGAGQTATLELDPADLPGLSFFDQLAAGIVEQRRDLMWSAENDVRVSQVMRAMTYKPEEGLFPSASSYLLTRSAIRRMGYAMENGINDNMRVELAELFWKIALMIENGDLTGAEARLRRAQERLSQALEDGATQDEIAELMDELRAATDDYMQELAESGQQQPQEQAQGESQTITQDQLQQMLDRIEELSQNGQTEEAQQLLEQLQEFMENMEVTQSQSQSGEGQRSEQQQQMQDSLEQQQELSDEAFQELQEQFDQQLQGQQPNPEQGQELADRQEALREFIEQLRAGQENGEDGEAGAEGQSEALDRAEQSMGNARDRLQQGDLSGALDEQAQAMEELRQGMRDLDAQNRADQAGADGDENPNDRQRDPLGRPIGSEGRADNGDTAVPDQNASERARELLEEIRRRSGDRERTGEELDYLKRLLDRF